MDVALYELIYYCLRTAYAYSFGYFIDKKLAHQIDVFIKIYARSFDSGSRAN